ncbi:hypothetical protein AAH979_37990 [Plantactinospora sp. ZYX-F-223]
MLREQGHLDDAVAVLRRSADAGYKPAADRSAEFLREQEPGPQRE